MCINKTLSGAHRVLQHNKNVHAFEFSNDKEKFSYCLDSKFFYLRPQITVWKNHEVTRINVDFMQNFRTFLKLDGVRISTVDLGYNEKNVKTVEYRFCLDGKRVFNLPKDCFEKNWFEVGGSYYNRICESKFYNHFFCPTRQRKDCFINYEACKSKWLEKVFKYEEGVMCRIDC